MEDLNDTMSNNDNTTLDAFYYYKTEQLTVLWILFIVIVAGNSGVMYALLFGRPRKSRMNFFITNLAFADLTVGLINVLTDIVWRFTLGWYAGNVACKIVKFLQCVVTYASTYVLVALSIDRYEAIRYPMKFSGSWKRAKCLIITAWLCSVLLSTPILILFKEESVQGEMQCWINLDAQWKWQLYVTLVSVSVFIIPACIITACYAIIIITIWTKSNNDAFHRAKKNTPGGRCMGIDDSKRASSRGLFPRAKIKTIKITFVIVSVFILCWSPYIVHDLLQVFDVIKQTQTNIAIATFIQSLAPLNSAANPIIYCIFSTHFCRKLRMIPPFKWICGRKSRSLDYTETTKSSSISEFLTNSTHHKKRSENICLSTTHSVLLH
ncbi:unnamed protein product [Brassicogethes aeneus]|uniref:G-protein coupled receptors family 1 profile domain-containing protein n=1 Tax=Brassicogethes aeneus TaxID=1431903 RepID=A0A9P0FQR9_BRAAE|nr:unnamed protein product [Brassicogethes aeneus]